MSWRLTLHDRKLSKARRDSGHNEMEGVKNRKDAEGNVSPHRCRPRLELGEKPQGDEDLQTPATSDLPLEETVPECSRSCHFQFEASLLWFPVFPECRSAC